MSIVIGNVVALVISGSRPKPALVEAVLDRRGLGYASPVLTLCFIAVENGSARRSRIAAVPFCEDAPRAEFQWSYPGPEVLIRGPITFSREEESRWAESES